MRFTRSGGRWGGGGAAPPSPQFANLPKMTLFSLLLHPKATSHGFGEDAFAHLFVLQKRLSFTLLCFLAFLLPRSPQRIRLGFAFLSVGEDVSFMIFFASNPLKRFRVAFSFLCVGEDVFYSFLHGLRERAGSPPFATRGAPSKRASKARKARDFLLRVGESNSKSTKAKR